MTQTRKNLIITTTLFLASVFLISSNYYRIVYLNDLVRGFLLDRTHRLFSRDSYRSGVTTPSTPPIKRTFDSLPPSYRHCGPFLLFVSRDETSLTRVAEDVITRTSFYRLHRLKKAIQSYNDIEGNTIPGGTPLIIPGALPLFVQDIKNTGRPAMQEVRGLYLTGLTAGTESTLEILPRLGKIGINALVFDVKDIPGIINYKSSVPMAIQSGAHERNPIDNVDLLIRKMKENKIYSIARIAVFHDHLIAKKYPSLAIRSKSRGGIWNRGSKEIWCDPTNRQVQDYNIELACEMADRGVDEIQFDYIRFPTLGDAGDAQFAWDFGPMTRDQAITHFLKRAYEALSKRNVRLSIDIFGVVAWGKEVDIRKTGQRIELLSQYCDYISPMLYPSHFNDEFDGYANPADNPYYFIYEGNRKVMERLAGRHVVIRPWLQAFKWKVSSYSPEYVLKQIQASRDSGAKGYLFWNASNDYKVVYRAMASLYGETGETSR